MFDFNPDPTIRHTFWTLVFGAPSQYLYLTITQAGIQRINSTPSISEARKLFYIAAPIFSLTWTLVLIQGLAIFAYFSDIGCDPLASGQVKNLNQIIPFTILELFHDYPGLPGLFIAALAAASLSSISSGLSSLSAVAYEDFIKVFLKDIKEQTATNISKGVIVMSGLIAVGFAVILSKVEGPLGQIMASFTGAITGPEVGLFLISIFFRRAQVKAVIIATLAGVAFVLWINIGQNFSASVPKAPYLPLGPTDQCHISNYMNTSNNSYIVVNQTETFRILPNTTIRSNTVTDSFNSSRTGLQTFYSISYMYFNLIGCIVVIVVGIVLNLLTQPKHPKTVSDNVVLPFYIFIPPFLKGRFSWLRKNSEPFEPRELESMINEAEDPQSRDEHT